MILQLRDTIEMDENFSKRVKDVISFSKDEAFRLGNEYIGTEHLLLGLIREGEGTAIKIMDDLNLDLKRTREKIESIASPGPGKVITPKKNLPLTRQAEKALKTTFLEAKLYQSKTIRTPHLLMCILRNQDDPVTRLLEKLGVNYDIVKEEFQSHYLEKEETKNELPFNDDDDEFDDWGDEEEDNNKYWFTKDKIDKIASVHNYLDSLPQIGKVLSFSSIISLYSNESNSIIIFTSPLESIEDSISLDILAKRLNSSLKLLLSSPITYISFQ